MSVYRVTEVIAEVVRQDVTIEDGRITGFRVRLALSFKYDATGK
jgi:flavin-binding protein dodecin